MGLFPPALHICTYDVRGVLTDTNETKPVRETGLVAHTHHLLRGIADRHPGTRVALTQTGAAAEGRQVARLLTPEGITAELRFVATQFPKYLRDPRGGKAAHLVRRYYEERIGDRANPVWRSLAEQYAAAIRAAAAPAVLLQNVNPIVATLKAVQAGLLDWAELGGLNLTGVVHDASGAEARFAYLARRIDGGVPVHLIAVSESVRQALLRAGVPAHAVRKVFNGMDVRAFDERLRRARAGAVWERVRVRNGVPAGRVVLVSARRVRWKGHAEVIGAARILHRQGLMDGVSVVINGAGLLDSRDLGYEEDLRRMIAEGGLERTVFLLDELSQEEVAACYVGAFAAVHPSREPEPFGYTNLEAMLAGVPVVASAHGGPLEYIDHDHSGLLVPPGDAAAVAAGLERLLTDKALHERLALGGRASAERFSLDAMFDGYQAAIAAGVDVARAGAR